MKIPSLYKAVAFAFARLLMALVLGYIAVGCILFPLWWKEFLFQGGILKAAFWREGFGYVGSAFKEFEPLAMVIVALLVVFSCYMLYWFGRHQSDSNKVTFAKKLAPGVMTLVSVGLVTAVAVGAAGLKKGKYSDMRPWDRLMRNMEEELKEFERSGRFDEFRPPENGVFLYVNEKLVLEQYEGLRGSLETTSVTESAGVENGIGASASIPLGAGSIDLSQKSSKEQTVTKTAPSVSATLTLRSLVMRFSADTNTFKLGYRSSLGLGESKWLEDALRREGVILTREQSETLIRSDKAKFQKRTQLLRERTVMLYHGDASLIKDSSDFSIQASYQGICEISLNGVINDKFVRDHLRLLLDSGTKTDVGPVYMLAIVQRIKRDNGGSVSLEVVPYAIW